MKFLNIGFYFLLLTFLISCEPYVPETIKNLAAEFSATYIISGMETHQGVTEEAHGDDVLIEVVNDSTINVRVNFIEFNEGRDINISGLDLYQSGEFVKFNQDFDDVNISGGTATNLADAKIFLLNVNYEDDSFIEIEARGK